MNLLDSLRAIIGKAGLTQNPEIEKILGNDLVKTLDKVELPTEISNLLNQNLINVESAKAHPDIAGHFKKNYLGQVDSLLETVLRENGFNEETITVIKKLDSTDNRVKTSFTKLKEKLETELKKEGGKKDNEEIVRLQNAITELQAKEKAEKERLQAEIQSKVNEISQVRTNYGLEKALSGFKFRSDLTPEQVITLAKLELDKKLNEAGAIMQLSETGEFKLKSKINPENDFYDTKKGSIVGFTDFVNNVIANSGLQQVSGGQGGNGGNGGNGGQGGNGGNGGNGGQNKPSPAMQFFEKMNKIE